MKEKIRYQPLYMQVKELLLKRIVNGEYVSGEIIPGESALAKDLETSVYTVRQAISLLVADGVLTKKQGKRTFVTERKTKLSFFSWIPETPRGERILSEVLALYQKRNPSVEIECIPTTYPKAKNHLTQLIANGEAPDVAQIASVWTSHFASMGAFEPLETLLSSDNLDNRIYEKDLAGGSYHQKLYSVAWGLCSFALIFHKKLLRQAGIEALPSPLTLDALHEILETLEGALREQEFYSYGLALSGRQSDFIRICAFLRMFDGGFTDEQGNIRFASPQNREGFRWLKEFVTRFKVFRSDVYTIRKGFAEGKIACVSDAPWIKYHLEELTGEPFEDNFEVALHPAHQSGKSLSLMYNHALGICSQSDNKLHAAKLIDALTNDPEISNYYFSRVGHLPSNAQHLNDSLYSSAFYDAYRAQLQDAVCINGQHEMFDRAVVFCLDAADNILFHDAEIERELDEKNHYLRMMYKNLPGFLMTET